MGLVTTNEVAKMLRCNVRTVQKYIREGKLQSYKIGRHSRIDMGQFGQFLKRSLSTNEINEINSFNSQQEN